MAVSKEIHAALTKAREIGKSLFTSGPNRTKFSNEHFYSTIPGVGRPMSEMPKVAGATGVNPKVPFVSHLPRNQKTFGAPGQD